MNVVLRAAASASRASAASASKSVSSLAGEWKVMSGNVATAALQPGVVRMRTARCGMVATWAASLPSGMDFSCGW